MEEEKKEETLEEKSEVEEKKEEKVSDENEKKETLEEKAEVEEEKEEKTEDEEDKKEEKIPEIKLEPKNTEQFQFGAEIQKLLDILINSIYTHKEIFLRELVSNSSDALDKIRFKMLTDQNVKDKDIPLEINIRLDKDNKKIIISDSGIGMTKEEIVENIGTIAHSGSMSFIEAMAKNKENAKEDINLIGQFGVGFYSVFMVADKVEVVTMSAAPDAKAYLWTSDGTGDYTIAEVEKEKRGTDVIVHLKEEIADEFLEQVRIKNIIQKYSDFVPYAIKLDKEQANKLSSLWTRSKNEVKEEEYHEFYSYLTHSPEKPLTHLHLSFDAPFQFYSILYIPSSIPWEISHGLPMEKWKTVHLYVRRVFIQADCEELMPQYLRFVRGVVDTDDLPLNISREVIQENHIISKIKSNLVRKVLDKLSEMAEKDTENYNKFWNNFGKFIKQGYRMDYDNREKIASLLRFNSSFCKDDKDLISLKDYVGRMKEDQKEVYYFTGESRQALENSAHIEIFKKKGIEVLYLTDPIDDFLFDDLREYEGKTFISIDREGINLDYAKSEKEEEDKEEKEDKPKISTKEEVEKFAEFLKEKLKDRVSDVRLSTRLVDSPCFLISDKNSMGVGVQKIMKMMDDKFQMPKRIMEINPDHILIQSFSKVYKNKPEEALLVDFSEQLLDNALIKEGTPFEIKKMVPRINKLMEKAMSLLIPKEEEKQC